LLAKDFAVVSTDIMIAGIGTDIVEIERIAKMIADHGDHFLERTFTPAEIAHCRPRREAAQHFAGRWAAKEAVMKALGTGFTKEVGWTDIEVALKPSGQPHIVLHGSAREYATRIGIDSVLVSISHTHTIATATAIAMQTATGAPSP
jgi:holo-[acyl-carrier protein] synthase